MNAKRCGRAVRDGAMESSSAELAGENKSLVKKTGNSKETEKRCVNERSWAGDSRRGSPTFIEAVTSVSPEFSLFARRVYPAFGATWNKRGCVARGSVVAYKRRRERS
jgi:hypothetical protein